MPGEDQGGCSWLCVCLFVCAGLCVYGGGRGGNRGLCTLHND